MFERAVKSAAKKIAGAKVRARVKRAETGAVEKIEGPVITLSGLSGAGLGEMIEIAGEKAIAMKLGRERVGAALLGSPDKIKAGALARRTFRLATVPVGEALLGRIIDPLGRALDGGPAIHAKEQLPIERPAPAIIDRAPVERPLQTGVKLVDAMIPIGRGQRELILGDRQTGKTALALDAIIAQKDTGVISIYCAIGGRGDSVLKAAEAIREHGRGENSIIVAAAGEASPAAAYIAPYAATSIAEYFAEKGKDVLVVYDSLSAHALAYRQLSLTLRRPPGREAFPSDVFYIHSRLLERACRLKRERGGGSITALPICETQGENLSAFIPTNLISITDGQIFLSSTLFQKGIIPAANVGISVSRVGGRAQAPAYKEAAGEMKIAYSQFEELEAFSKFGTSLDEATRAALTRGERVREILKQPQLSPVSAGLQAATIMALNAGLFDRVPMGKIAAAESALHAALSRTAKALLSRIEKGARLSKAEEKALSAASAAALRRYFAKEKGGADHTGA